MLSNHKRPTSAKDAECGRGGKEGGRLATAHMSLGKQKSRSKRERGDKLEDKVIGEDEK